MASATQHGGEGGAGGRSLEASILQEIEAVLRKDNQEMTQSRLARIEDVYDLLSSLCPEM